MVLISFEELEENKTKFVYMKDEDEENLYYNFISFSNEKDARKFKDKFYINKVKPVMVCSEKKDENYKIDYVFSIRFAGIEKNINAKTFIEEYSVYPVDLYLKEDNINLILNTLYEKPEKPRKKIIDIPLGQVANIDYDYTGDMIKYTLTENNRPPLTRDIYYTDPNDILLRAKVSKKELHYSTGPVKIYDINEAIYDQNFEPHFEGYELSFIEQGYAKHKSI